jgi:hypothetical protein
MAPEKLFLNMKFVKIVVFVPVSHAEKVREAFGKNGAGHIGNYDFCSFSSKGLGRFRPLKGAHPFIGKQSKIEKVPEERIETICPKKSLKKVLTAVKKAHPYEEPAIDVYPLL